MSSPKNCESATLDERLTAATFDASCRPQFYKCLPVSSVYVGVSGVQHRGQCFHTVRRSNTDHVAVFTSPTMVPSKYKPIKICFGELLDLLGNQSVSLNPGQSVTKDFSCGELMDIKNGNLCSPTKYQKGELKNTKLGMPKKSRSLWPDVINLLKDHPGVIRAWSSDLVSGSGSSRLTGAWLGIDCPSELDWRDVSQECTILLNTLDDPPPLFIVERLEASHPTHQSSARFYEKGGEVAC